VRKKRQGGLVTALCGMTPSLSPLHHAPFSLPLSFLVRLSSPGVDAAHLVKDMIPGSLLPKLRRMVELMLTAEYMPAQEGYISSRSRVIQQVRAGGLCVFGRGAYGCCY
jgi:hypothetical protein